MIEVPVQAPKVPLWSPTSRRVRRFSLSPGLPCLQQPRKFNGFAEVRNRSSRQIILILDGRTLL